MRPLYRCTYDGRACPASGNVLALDSSDDADTTKAVPLHCPVCKLLLHVPARNDRRAGWLLRLPSHRRPQEVARERDAQKTRAHERIAAVAELRARAALKRGRGAEAAIRRALAALDALPADPATSKRVLYWRRKLGEVRDHAIPKSPAGILAVLERTSGIDLGAVEPDNFADYLSAVLPEAAVRALKRKRPTAQVRAGILAVLRAAKPRRWSDLDKKGLRGPGEAPLPFLRGFPGLDQLRRPDDAIEAELDALGVPF